MGQGQRAPLSDGRGDEPIALQHVRGQAACLCRSDCITNAYRRLAPRAEVIITCPGVADKTERQRRSSSALGTVCCARPVPAALVALWGQRRPTGSQA